jgi:hypothetical protein
VTRTAELLRDSGHVCVHLQRISLLPAQPDPSSEDYSCTGPPLKALYEHTIADAFSQRALVFRSGLIVGPFDPTRPPHLLGARRAHDASTAWRLESGNGRRVGAELNGDGWPLAAENAESPQRDHEKGPIVNDRLYDDPR